jgi:hypothetical protein
VRFSVKPCVRVLSSFLFIFRAVLKIPFFNPPNQPRMDVVTTYSANQSTGFAAKPTLANPVLFLGKVRVGTVVRQ